MDKCVIRWRPSGGRGEWEFVPKESLVDRHIFLEIPVLDLTIDTEVYGAFRNGKPRLRKKDSNNRKKLHLVPLIMAAARLPEPAREDKGFANPRPLENKQFLITHLELAIKSKTDIAVVVEPLSARILRSNQVIDFRTRFSRIADDNDSNTLDKELAEAISAHKLLLLDKSITTDLRTSADFAIKQTSNLFGKANSITTNLAKSLPETILEEDLSGKEGRILTRLHSYRERDRTLIRKAKKLFVAKHGELFCECCSLIPGKFYGLRGKSKIEAHHRTPVEQLMPDSITTPEDLAMVCPNCHSVIHAERPWITPEELRSDLISRGSIYS